MKISQSFKVDNLVLTVALIIEVAMYSCHLRHL
ncbi:hypothetical protein SAMN05216299_1308 [Nitrosospira sp. Nsp14]|nr:hypothetical protein SAMN05216299_1308 [Nitrosospira sp. Nsp14]